MVCIILPANSGTGQPPQNTTTHKVTLSIQLTTLSTELLISGIKEHVTMQRLDILSTSYKLTQSPYDLFCANALLGYSVLYCSNAKC